MPTYQTKTTGGTPITRAAQLLESALSTSSNAASTSSRGSLSSALQEVHALISGQEDYLERNSSELIVPRSHAKSENEVRTVWNELLEMTQETDWARLKNESRTKFELGAGMCSGPYEAVVLQNLALLQRTRSVLEIGVFTGTATLALALVPSVTEIVALDIEPYLKETVEPYWDRAGVLNKIDFRIAPALESLAALAEAKHEPFDLVFIDADKPSYRAYVQAVLDGGLLSAGGVILAVSDHFVASA
jgi:caffeoyl-CoA O-methyltransferase